MKIIRKDKGHYCRFEELEVGEVFIEDVEDGSECIQMKTEEVGEGYGDCNNVVSLNTGCMYWLNGNTIVRRVHAELIIRNIEEA